LGFVGIKIDTMTGSHARLAMAAQGYQWVTTGDILTSKQ